MYEGLPELSEVRVVQYAAADGLEIHGYLTLPRGRPATALPLVVLPHGGPADRDVAGFDWWSQALAAAGYAVLQPNYRGSTIDAGFVSAGFGEWGRKMQTDLSDGVRFLVNERIVDPARVCIVGASYGGYAALAGVALQSGAYRCAVSVAGPSDLRQFLHWIDERTGRNRSRERYWDRFMGVKSANDPTLDTISPARHAASVSVPVLIVHGRDDTVVPFEQSQIMADALERAGKRVELVALPGEDHWLSRSSTRLQMLEHVIAFLNANNPVE
jgi:dipeptidyl aminopeptidase/acylaminoacyl peptidase